MWEGQEELRGKMLLEEKHGKSVVQKRIPARVINEIVKQPEPLHGGTSKRKLI